MSSELELIACQPHPLESNGFNLNAALPYDCKMEHIVLAMNNFVEFLGFINQQLYSKEMERLEVMLMPANFSSMVGEFMISNIPKYCSSLVKNQYHNGHPDLIPAGMFLKNSVQHSHIGIEVKASRYQSGWQGHNPEDTWLMIFVFDSNRPSDAVRGIQPKPFRFIKVVGASLTKNDWSFSGRSEISRRTITASVTKSGYQKMMSNWIYQIPNLP
ncbi:hypothetical protein NIES4072_13770 [Nostoc commune NIES-4072]|uniref:Uncharacterized protein n=1 Tax=Nostoc commune NIES-4072 TaxID=2005467 RepID=A0A2R5FGI9_NOSCO|nr:hypothetical protein [Nostoc commune]BBD64959.1 hypothetical protein NIES4070_13050 [Nostoc commune HK-02]GBG17716.1 hypothetical protein NIES4072_13770 [Nostoc commune NIES-4072]